ncbi:glycosyltransferase family 39 protein [Clostridium sp. SHJSY1]|uniref:glycosyltransferase family 39 protein n=1 Tax=Clostridium sp. SHJSY1 TaxID=2942483 RepID=UPI002876ED3B|nr:glycosyltransferase family 39 protein [Clostridium sp. SHJSY1]MDS0525974.1 glycosyltransferase family 39 protein [Clostridium sp. SHJSY1]
MNKFKLNKERIGLILILILSAILNLVNLNIQGYSNEYYSAGVKSMLNSFKNFFFVSFDPTGFVSLDKPPVGFWMQAISAKIFGFNGWSIILPQAIAGVISVGLLYCIVKKYFGGMAGLISALCLAITPIFVATSRNNNVDIQLVLVLLVASYFFFKAIESEKLKHLIICIICVGIGFNIKMLEAYLICPAIYFTYLIASKIEFKKRIINLVICSFVLVAVSLSWAIIVDLMPASERPYVGSSSTNSEIQLIVGHNGVERVSSNSNMMSQAIKGMQGMLKKAGMKTTSFGGGEPGITRLFSAQNSQLPDQISWLLPFAIFGFIAAALKEKLKKPFDNERKLSIVFWITYLVPQSIYFSITSGTFEPYYLTMMAVPIAALVGIGIKYMIELYKGNTWMSYILPVAFIIDGILELVILSAYLDISNVTKVLMIAIMLLSFGSAIFLIVNKIKNKVNIDLGNEINLKKASITLGLIGLLITPTVWSGTTLVYKMFGSAPSAGLQLRKNAESKMMSSIMNMVTGSADENTFKLISYLEANKGNEKYLLVSSRTSEVSSIILNTNESVMALGGYMGTDKIITLDEFKQKVKDGEVRFVITDGMSNIKAGNKETSSNTDMSKKAVMSLGGMEKSSNTEIVNWVKENGQLVNQNKWSNSTEKGKEGSQGAIMAGSKELYDLKDCIIN